MKNKLTLSLKNIYSGGAKNIALTILSVLAGGIIYNYQDAIIANGIAGEIALYVLVALAGLGTTAGGKKTDEKAE